MITQILEYLFSNPVKSLWNGIKLIGSGISGGKWGSDNIYSNLWRALNGEDVTAGSSGSDLIQTLREQGSSWLNAQTQAHMTGAQVEQNAWTAEREDTVHQRNVSDMLNAGLNPALMYGSAGPTSTSASASGGSGASLSDLLGLITLPLQMKSLEADIAKKEEDTKGLNLDNEFKEQTLSSRAEAVNLANSLTRSQTAKLDSELDQIVANTNKLAEEAKTEESKRELNFASALLSRINAYTAVEMLPYSQMLAEAQTQAQKNYASLMAVQTLYNRKLINSGYIDAICDQMKASATSTEAKAAVDKINSDIRSGKFGNDGSFLGQLGSSLLQGTVLALDQLRGIASIGLHFGKNLSKDKSSNVPNSGNYDPFGYLAGE